MTPRAIFFDLDDTLIDDSSGVDSGWREAITACTAGLAIDIETLVDSVFKVRAWYWSDPDRHRVGRADLRQASTWIVGEALSHMGVDNPALSQRIAHQYRDIREDGRKLLPGAVETLDQARELGIRIALLTNGPSLGQRAKLTQFDLDRHFDFIGIEGEFGYGKPDERVYRSALSALDTSPAEVWMVGDNLEWDVAGPMRIGITGIWYDRFARGMPDRSPVQPDRIVTSLAELLAPGES